MKCPHCGAYYPGKHPREIELLPCPCCGGKAEFDDKNGELLKDILVRCTVCDLNTPLATHAEAAAVWNKRFQPDLLPCSGWEDAELMSQCGDEQLVLNPGQSVHRKCRLLRGHAGPHQETVWGSNPDGWFKKTISWANEQEGGL
jgi:hypothetical protein